mmetsp:Transcript_8883/g.21804  ORF Transcript_8883/g.21804 Transcript_8883/m.21804 type:complete len:251 (-) Transcript_8883:211-963(-)
MVRWRTRWPTIHCCSHGRGRGRGHTSQRPCQRSRGGQKGTCRALARRGSAALARWSRAISHLTSRSLNVSGSLVLPCHACRPACGGRPPAASTECRTCRSTTSQSSSTSHDCGWFLPRCGGTGQPRTITSGHQASQTRSATSRRAPLLRSSGRCVATAPSAGGSARSSPSRPTPPLSSPSLSSTSLPTPDGIRLSCVQVRTSRLATASAVAGWAVCGSCRPRSVPGGTPTCPAPPPALAAAAAAPSRFAW